MRIGQLIGICIMAVVVGGGIVSYNDHPMPENQTHHQEMPMYVQNGHPDVQMAYQHAMDYPDDLAEQPCYCGCSNVGHMNNLDCFVSDIASNGDVIFDQHGAYCGVCVNVALETVRLKREGYSPLEIRLYLDDMYSNLLHIATDTAYPEA